MIDKATKRVIPNYTSDFLDGLETKKAFSGTVSSSQNLDISTQLDDFERTENIKHHLLDSDTSQFTIKEVHHTPRKLEQDNKRAFDHLSLYHDETDLRQNAKILVVRSQQYELDQDFYLILTGPWLNFTYSVGSTLSVLGKFDQESYSKVFKTYIGVKRYKEQGVWKKGPVKKFSDIDLLIIDPEIKVKVTDLTGDNKDCDRFNVLNRFYSNYKGYNKWGLDGTIQHNLFEEIISKDVQSELGKKKSDETDHELKKLIYE